VIPSRRARRIAVLLLGCGLLSPFCPSSYAGEARWNLHGQVTFVQQGHPSFTSPYQGTNSLTPGRDSEETSDLTLFAGVRLWRGAALYVNPEIDQGFGLDDTLGVAGFPSGEAYKVGKSNPLSRWSTSSTRMPTPMIPVAISSTGP
jgi:high affinity Mn2+ porin